MSYGVGGALGLRTNIRTYKDVVQDASWSKTVLTELYPGLAVTDWSVHSGSVYVAAAFRVHDGVRLDVAGVRTLQGSLARSRVADVTTLAAGEFWYDVQAVATDARWDDGTSAWDDGVIKWDEFLKLYVRLTDSSNPALDEVEAEFLLAFASRAETHPALGTNLLTNGTFEAFTASEPDSWTKTDTLAAGGTPTTSKGATPYLGAGDLTITLANVPTGGRTYYQAATVVPGQAYRVGFAYRGTGGHMFLEEMVGNTQAKAGGVDWAASQAHTLPATPEGEWRRATFDVIIPTGGTSVRLYLGAYTASTTTLQNGVVSFDDVSLRPIDRMVHYSPRIAGANIPSISTASNDIFFGGKQTGVGSVTLLNQDKYFEVLSTLDWVNAKCVMKVGGAYNPDATGPQETLAVEDYRTAFTGLIQQVRNDDTEINFDIQDIRASYFQTVPPRTYDATADFPTMSPADAGAFRALWFGRKSGVRPIRYGVAGNDYGSYEVADCTDAPNGIVAINNVWAYVDEGEAVRVAQTQTTADLTTFRRLESAYKRSASTWTKSNVSENQGQLYKTSATAWDGGAYSDITIEGDEAGRFEATVGRSISAAWMLGFTLDNPDWSYTSLDFALYCTDGLGADTYQVWENNVMVFDSTLASWTGDRLRVTMVGDGTVEYCVNGKDTDGWELLYTSTATAAGTYFCRFAANTLNTAIVAPGVYLKSSAYHTTALATGRFDINEDFQALEVTKEDNYASIKRTTEYQAFVQPGIYTPEELAYQWQGSAWGLIYVVGAVAVPTYSDTTHKFTIVTDGTTQFLFGSGQHRDVYRTLGFTQGDDSVAATTTDTAESPVFTDVDKDHIFRVDGTGFADDALGTYTGVANGTINRGSNILHALLVAFLKQPATVIDTASFLFARDNAPEAVSVHLNRETPLKDVMETLEFTNIANIAIGGDGVVYYDVYVGTSDSDILTTVTDPDFASFGMTWEAADVYKTIRVFHNQDPEGNYYPFRTATIANVETRFGRKEVREFKTWLRSPDGAQTTADRLSELAQAPARQLRATVRGKLLDHRVGQKIRVTRGRAASAGGLLSSSVFRIISIRQSHALGLSQIVAVPDVVTVARVACAEACQAQCEVNCQEVCEVACQTSCEQGCEVGCETSCQSCDQTSCQESCETSCQETCELAGQCDACQAGCQTACQAACQSACQSNCQATCQVGCQETCETTCQVTCETTCQSSCEVGCQSACETGCQSSCEAECQDAYQTEYFP